MPALLPSMDLGASSLPFKLRILNVFANIVMASPILQQLMVDSRTRFGVVLRAVALTYT